MRVVSKRHGRCAGLVLAIVLATPAAAGAQQGDDGLGTVFGGTPAPATDQLQLAEPQLAGDAPESPVGPADCSSGVRTLSKLGDRVYPDQGNGGYVSVHTDLHIFYAALTNQFLPGNHADLTIRATQCLTDFSLDFERTSALPNGPNMAVSSVAIDGAPATFDFRQPTYPGNPNGPDDPDPLAHAISNQNPVSATNPNPPACSPQVNNNTQNGL
jgi:hypothetical protein